MLHRSLRKGRIASAASHREQKDSNADDTSELHGFTLGTATAKRLQAQRLLAKRDETNSHRGVWPQFSGSAGLGHKPNVMVCVPGFLPFEMSFN